MAAEECLVGAAPDYKGRIGSINSTLFTYDYIGSRVLQRSHYVTGGNDIDVDYAYDNLGRVTDIVSSDGTIDFDYTYAAGENNIADIAFNHRTSTPSNDFVYDNLDRLSSVEYLDDTTDTEAFTMDLLGNRTNVNLRDGNDQAYTVNNANNRYTAVASNSLTYDNAGNTTTDQNDHTYTYDYENRIETITRPSDSSTIVTYTYDALGRRIKMVDAITPANSRLYYFSDNWQVLEEYSVAAVPARTAYYVWGNYIDELLFIWNGGNSLAAHALQDHLFSTVALVNVTDGTVLERCEYNAYGKVTVYTNMNDWQTGTPPTTQNYSAYGNPYLFTGRRLDKLDSGNYKKYHYRHRDYDADTGRFLQKDPLATILNNYFDSMNLYEYVTSRPLYNTDPLGLVPYHDPLPGPGGFRKLGRLASELFRHFLCRKTFSLDTGRSNWYWDSPVGVLNGDARCELSWEDTNITKKNCKSKAGDWKPSLTITPDNVADAITAEGFSLTGSTSNGIAEIALSVDATFLGKNVVEYSWSADADAEYLIWMSTLGGRCCKCKKLVLSCHAEGVDEHNHRMEAALILAWSAVYVEGAVMVNEGKKFIQWGQRIFYYIPGIGQLATQ